MYAQNNVINFHLSSFFLWFYFCGSRSVCENRKNFRPAKISHYVVVYQTGCSRSGDIKHLEVVYQKIYLEKGLVDWKFTKQASISQYFLVYMVHALSWVDWVSSHVCSYLQRYMYCSLPAVTYTACTGNATQTTHQKSTHVLSGHCALPYPQLAPHWLILLSSIQPSNISNSALQSDQ